MMIEKVTVIGANGTMGSNVAGMFASFGAAEVFLVSRDKDKSQTAALKAVRSVRADSIMNRLVVKDFSEIDECVRKSDLVFESVSENLEIKQSIIKIVASSLRKDAVFATGSSGLSITTLSESLPIDLRGNYFGVHMFNPPYNLTLCELIPSKYSDDKIKTGLKEYLTNVLHRTVVEVKDSPAFLGNRIGFQFLNRALQYAEQYQTSGGIDYIDAILGPFTGRAMAPLATIDFVGLDVHKAIVDNILVNAADYAKKDFVLPGYCQQLIDQGKLGRKRKQGLYKMVIADDGQRRLFVYDISANAYRPKVSYDLPFVRRVVNHLGSGNYRGAAKELVQDESIEGRLCLSMLLEYIAYSLYAAKGVSYSPHDADDAMATGYNWCPPLALTNFLSQAKDIQKLLQDRLSRRHYQEFINNNLVEGLVESRYDYRSFLKAKM